ncbi:MAG: hypothetical protein IPL55_01250 [Saprospiraceae bacterium]|nr:hypothetical protein [Saprospiraceae bacterium]
MKFSRHIFLLVLSAFTALFSLTPEESALSPQGITVIAGNDRTMCLNQSLVLSSLGATISGDVTDGTWISLGDGLFQPGNLSTVRYSAAQQNNITYVPGTDDKTIRGFYRLMLISDDGNGNEKKTSEVKITFQTAPPLFCNSNINISLNENCIQVVDASMLQSNPVPPLSNYTISIYDSSGKLIPNNTLTRDHIDKEITYKLGHQCTANYCWGKFVVQDYYPPVFACRNDTILCTKPTVPESVGFPIPIGAKIDTLINNIYTVSNWDQCSKVTLEYKDEIIKANCAKDEDRTIVRKWKATDAKGNSSTCDQKIVIKRIPLAAVIFPPHYDGNDKPAFECGDKFPVFSNGHPSTDTTGFPIIGNCSNLQFNMTDVRFDLCGKTFKIARSWFVIDWCTSESITRNQIIMIKDSKGPQMMCLDTLRLEAGAYFCKSGLSEIPQLSKILDCNQYTLQYELKDRNGFVSNQFIKYQQQKYYLDELPVGIFYLAYIATDLCNNTSTCSTVIQVKDNIAPNVVCKQTIKVSLDGTGRARVMANSFDNGSNDNCGIAAFSVRKMNDKCGFGTAFGAYVDFCCDEIGTTIMVAMEVTDIYGNKNTCMVEVNVEDKLRPVITCPPNITLTCTDNYDLKNLDIFGKVVTKSADIKNVLVYNYYHNGIAGKDGLATDNCSVTVNQSYIVDIKCFTGTIKRKFVATDASGLKDSCTQTITIANPNPFNGNDTLQLKWPQNFESEGCKSTGTSPDITGSPIFNNTSCGTIAATFEDTPFYIADGACVKIIRRWTVVDWCQFTGLNNIGKWGPYIQLIKLHNTDKPEFTSICKDTVFCSYDNKCKTGWVQLSQSANDSCTAISDLIWKYELDLNNDGTIDSTGTKNDFAGDLPMGSHKITWRVDDQCGNFNTCTFYFKVKDCKKPTPYCLTSVTTSLMQTTGNIEIWAKDFDNGSSDNCTEYSQLLFTFDGELPVDSMQSKVHYFKGKGILSNETEYKSGLSQKWTPLTKSSGKYLDCKNIPDGKSAKIPLKMTITDLVGNQDFCTVELILQDNADLCPDVINQVMVTGKVSTENYRIPLNTEIKYEAVEIQGSKLINNINGQYQLDKLPVGKAYTITPYLNSDPLEGVSTLDLILIQRHILGLNPFDSPYKVLAADVNSSATVTAADLVELRKLILGVTDKFPKDLPSWIFVSKKNGLPEPENPFLYVNKIETGILGSDMIDADFMAVKVGDVNLSAYNFSDPDVENRNKDGDTFTIFVEEEQIDGQRVLTFRAGQDIRLSGYQLFLQCQSADHKLTKIETKTTRTLENTELYVKDDRLRMIGYDSKSAYLKKGEIIAVLGMTDFIDIARIKLESFRNSEIYSDDRAINIKLASKLKSPLAFQTFRLLTNPVTSILTLNSDIIDSEAMIQFTIVNTRGEELSSGNFQNSSDIIIPLSAGLSPGIYYLQLHHNGFSQTLKFIRIR